MTNKFPSKDLTTKIKADFKKCPKNFLKTAEFGVQDKNILKSLRHVTGSPISPLIRNIEKF